MSDDEEKEEVCPICGGTGWVIPDLPVGHPDFGKAVPCVCQLEKRRKQRYQELLRISNLGALSRKTFDSFHLNAPHLNPAQRQNLKEVYEQAKAFAENPQGWLVLLGDYGCGKTHLAAAIANHRIRKGHMALFVVVPDLLDYLRAAYAPGSPTTYDQRFEDVRNAPLLILDDLGTHNATPWAEEKLFQILNYRYNGNLPTVITSNQWLESIPARIRSRIMDSDVSTVAEIIAPDYRSRESSGIGIDILPLLKDMTFETWDVRKDLKREDRDNLAHALALAKKYAENPHGWLTFYGTYGCGKTHLAAAIANYRVQKGERVTFVVVADLLDYLRAAFSPNSSVTYDKRFDRIKRMDFLVLDDLGTQNTTPWAKEKLFQLLNYRYNALLPTVITTVHTPDELDPWIRTRLTDPTHGEIWGITAPSYRPNRRRRKRA